MGVEDGVGIEASLSVLDLNKIACSSAGPNSWFTTGSAVKGNQLEELS